LTFYGAEIDGVHCWSRIGFSGDGKEEECQVSTLVGNCLGTLVAICFFMHSMAQGKFLSFTASGPLSFLA
jgi:hypothetical protein